MAKHTEENKSRKACLCESEGLVLFLWVETRVRAVDAPLAAGATCGGYWGMRMSPAYVLPCVKGTGGVQPPSPAGFSSPLAPLRGGPFLTTGAGLSTLSVGTVPLRPGMGRRGGGPLKYALGRWLRNDLVFIPSGPELPKLWGQDKIASSTPQ